MRPWKFLAAGLTIGLLLFGGPASAQTDRAVELLTMAGGKPALGPNGEGIASFKTSDLYKVGQTHVKPFDDSFKIELPAGYTLFNKLAYIIDTEAMFSGLNDFSFKLPSAGTRNIFDKLRILYAAQDYADPERPRWVDATVELPFSEYWKNYLSKTEFDKALPDFSTRSLHAVTEESPRLLLVAVKDSSIARDHFTADIAITGNVPQQVMEGRQLTYDLKITNIGPDDATDVTLHAQPTFNLISVTASQDKCRMEASNVYCKFARLEKGKSISVKIVEKCPWNAYFKRPEGYGGFTEPPPQGKNIRVGSAEIDPDYENNNLELFTEILGDSNKAPIAEIASPKRDELIAGPDPSVTIVVKASDPDGFIREIELSDWGEPLGNATLKSGQEYELVYPHVSFGRHTLMAKVTDNLGRETETPSEFFVNGLTDVEIISPREGAKLTPTAEGIPVVIRATNSKLKIKEVAASLFGIADGGQTAKPAGDDNYVITLHNSPCKRDCQVSATVIDESGVATRSALVHFKITNSFEVTLRQQEGEYWSKIPENRPFDSRLGLSLSAQVDPEPGWEEIKIVKFEFFVNGKLFDSWTRTSGDNEDYAAETDLSPLSPGTYQLQVIATDSDGSVGKSQLVEIVIKKN